MTLGVQRFNQSFLRENAAPVLDTNRESRSGLKIVLGSETPISNAHVHIKCVALGGRMTYDQVNIQERI